MFDLLDLDLSMPFLFVVGLFLVTHRQFKGKLALEIVVNESPRPVGQDASYRASPRERLLTSLCFVLLLVTDNLVMLLYKHF